MFIIDTFMIAPNLETIKELIGAWVKKICSISYNEILFSDNITELSRFEKTRRKLKCLLLSKRNQYKNSN